MDDHQMYLKVIAEVTEALKAEEKPSDKILLTRQEAAAALRVSLPTFDALTRTGKLRAVYVGRLVRIRQSELDRFTDGEEG